MTNNCVPLRGSGGWAALSAMLLLPTLAPAAPSPAINEGLVAHFPFENNLVADGSAATEGKAIGGVSFNQGVLGSALELHGDDYVEVPDNSAMHSDTFSICAWVCPRQDMSSGRIAEKGSSNSFWLNLNDNKVRFGFYSDRYHEVDSGAVLKPNEWSFVAGTYDGKAIRVYINGELQGMVLVTDKPNFNHLPLVIGWKRGGIGADHLLGWVDELRIYNRALTLPEVETLSQMAGR